MEVVIDQKGEETVIKIKGRLDTNTAPGRGGKEFSGGGGEGEEKVLPVWENPGVKVCVDCSDLEYVSSAGLRLFLILQKMTTAKKGSLRLIGMRNVVRETFSLTGFNALFKIEDAK
jgi:anti-sigma factor antagonist